MHDATSFFRLDSGRIDQIRLPGCEHLKVFLKRDDLIHPFISGNKWHKLKFNCMEAQKLGKTRLVTFGGAYSNHLLAVACASAALGFRSLAFLRGDESVQNHMLRLCTTFGMELIPVSRNDYKDKKRLLETIDLSQTWVLPEGGTNELAVKGVAEAARALGERYDHWVVPAGTGGTFAGLVSAAADRFPNTLVDGIATVKAAPSLESTVNQLTNRRGNGRIHHAFTHGGYGKTNSQLDKFCDAFARATGILIEPVYSGKMLYAVCELARENYFPKSARILCFHTGGLLGSRVFLT